MQGRKDYQEELFVSFQLSDRVPENNFYRRMKELLQLDYLYKLTSDYYGDCGQKSIDPVVFFKLCLVGYLENITTDRGLMNHCGMRLDIPAGTAVRFEPGQAREVRLVPYGGDRAVWGFNKAVMGPL